MSAIVVKSLSKTFREGFWLQSQKVLNDVSFTVPDSGITGFVGQNGSGKTTSIKCILRLIRPDEGAVSVFGEDEFTPEIRRQIGFLPERPYFQKFLSAEEFLVMHMRLSGIPVLRSVIHETLEKVGLEHAIKHRLSGFSKGMLQRVGFAQALIHQPKLVILDEPLSGLDPEGRHLFKSIIQSVANEGVSIFFSSHLLFDVQELCKNIIVIDSGQVVFEGGVDKLIYPTDDYLLEYQQASGAQSVKVGVGELQSKIDQIRQEQGEIIAVTRVGQSLESAVHTLRESFRGPGL